MVPREEADILDLDYQRTFENFEKIFIALAKMIHMRLLQAGKAKEWVAKLCDLHFKSSIVNQHLLMLVHGSVTHSEFLNSLDGLRISLRQVVNEMERGLEQSM
ncbi:hypothetical protein AFCA_009604 [Aspergillus flavus]|nr:hypothetical protein AFCA_009604 [Aspergillus flavus]